MASSRPIKRTLGPDAQPAPPGKKQKQTAGNVGTNKRPSVVRGLLGQYYRSTHTLRQYMLCRLPTGSRIRRKKIASMGLDANGAIDHDAPENVRLLCQALDTFLVCTRDAPEPLPIEERRQEWAQMSQQAMADDSTVTISSAGRVYCQTELVDFVIWLLFSRNQSSSRPPKHLLCHGFNQRRAPNSRAKSTSIPSLFSESPNHHAEALRDHPWPEVLALLGKAGDAVMVDMLLDSAVFVPVEAGHGNYWQLSGVPMSEVQRIDDFTKMQGSSEPKLDRSPSDIVFIRSRMMYARAALTGHGDVETGFRHIHVLNRRPHVSVEALSQAGASEREEKNERACTNVMMYMFPRQFGLHNVFDSPTDSFQTVQKLHDYTMREDEISSKFPADGSIKTPKRLRGETRRLVQRLQILHGRCSHAQMLWHYCPTSLDTGNSKKTRSKAVFSHAVLPSAATAEYPSTRALSRHSQGKRKNGQSQPYQATSQAMDAKTLLEAATPTSHVSAFCQAVLSKIIPDDFWGIGETRMHNKESVMKKVDSFVKLRQFESMSLHDVVQDLKITDIPWLAPPGLGAQKACLSDVRKRTEIFLEFIYYVFDSLLIPLIRSNFYVTESNVFKYRLLFFRHDVWKHVAEPAMAIIKASMFEEIKTPKAQDILASRKLGFSQIRLLPKERGVRPVMNLRKRQLQGPPGKKRLGPSINSVLSPVHAMLKLEKARNPSLLGSSMFSVGDIYHRLKDFGRKLARLEHRPKLFFAKADVKAAFDTIPQSAVLRLMGNVPSEGQKEYTIAKHVEVKPSDGAPQKGAGPAAAPPGVKRWHTAAVADPSVAFPDRVGGHLAPSKKNTIFVDSAASQTHNTVALLTLMAEHVDKNLVKIGKKFYRQKSGVPQGSVLSSILCNYFYGDLEATRLQFLAEDDGCLLMRLIDDFLLITTDEAKAARFVRTMHAGMPEYGVSVSPAKTLVNFELEVAGQPVARVYDGDGFPYCGTLIDCKTLAISKDHTRRTNAPISNSLTVDFGRMPGRNFQRKVLKAFQIQSHVMFFDTQHNSERAVLANIYDSFVETATKMWAHARCLAPKQQPGPRLVIDTIAKTVDVASSLLTGASRKAKYPGYKFSIKRQQIAWLGYHAFKEALARKQTTYVDVLGWLDERIEDMRREKQAAWLPRVPPRRG